MSTTINAPGCPFHGRTLPTDGTPLAPSPTLERWREEGAATPLAYPDGHDGLIVTRYDLARAVLSDERFTVSVQRFPMPAAQSDETLDGQAQEALRVANILGVDGDEHLRLRRAILPRFSLKAVRQRQAEIAEIVADQLDAFLRLEQPADIFKHYATPISARVQRLMVGVPDDFGARYDDLFAGASTTQEKFDFLRLVIAQKRDAPGDDVISHLLSSGYADSEVEGLTFTVMTAGRDSVAYFITTATVALLSHRDQWNKLRLEPERMPGAIEEFLRVGTMFLTLFPRTATEDLELDGVHVAAGQTVAVSPVAANRDERRFDGPASFDIARDAFGHLGFSYGPHGCVGQQLARVEIAEAVSQLIAATPDMVLVHADQLTPQEFASNVATYEAGEALVAWNV